VLNANRVSDWFVRAQVKDKAAIQEEVSRKDAKVERKAQRRFLAPCSDPLRLCVKYSPVSPNRFPLLHKRFHALVRVLSLHQLVQIDVFLFA